MIKFTITAGDQPTVRDTLTVPGTDAVTDLTPGAVPDLDPVDLTGAAVALLFEGAGGSYSPAATILDPAAGTVQYTFTPAQTAQPGVYRAQWQITAAGGAVTTSPRFEFEIRAALAVPDVTQFTRLSDLFEDVRAVTGDFKKQVYEDCAIASVMRTQLRMGRVKTDGCGSRGRTRWTLGPDGNTLQPAILSTDIEAYSLLVYYSALTLVTPNLAAYSYRTRALSERFGEQKDFLAEMKLALYEIENGNQTWANVTGLRSWLFAVNGIWVWSYQQAEDTINLSFQ